MRWRWKAWRAAPQRVVAEAALFAQSLLIGLSIAAPVGPIGLLVIQRTLQRGAIVGLVTGLGAAVADALYGAVGAFGVSWVIDALVGARVPLALGGGAFLLWLAWRIWHTPPADSAAQAGGGAGLLSCFAGTFVLTLSNPATIFSFIAVFGTLGARMVGQLAVRPWSSACCSARRCGGCCSARRSHGCARASTPGRRPGSTARRRCCWPALRCGSGSAWSAVDGRLRLTQPAGDIPMADPHNRIALVTGAGSGIGKASALRLLEDGWRVVFAGRRLDALREAIAAAGDPFGDIDQRALAVPADMTRADSVAALFDVVRARFGRLDLLFNNAGTGAPPVLLEDLTVEQWRSVVDTNLNGVFSASSRPSAS